MNACIGAVAAPDTWSSGAPKADGTVKGCPRSLPWDSRVGMFAILPWNTSGITAARFISAACRLRSKISGDSAAHATTLTSVAEAVPGRRTSLLGKPGNNPYCHYCVSNLGKAGSARDAFKDSGSGSGGLRSWRIRADRRTHRRWVHRLHLYLAAAIGEARRERGYGPLGTARRPRSPSLELCRACHSYIWPHETNCPHLAPTCGSPRRRGRKMCARREAAMNAVKALDRAVSRKGSHARRASIFYCSGNAGFARRALSVDADAVRERITSAPSAPASSRSGCPLPHPPEFTTATVRGAMTSTGRPDRTCEARHPERDLVSRLRVSGAFKAGARNRPANFRSPRAPSVNFPTPPRAASPRPAGRLPYTAIFRRSTSGRDASQFATRMASSMRNGPHDSFPHHHVARRAIRLNGPNSDGCTPVAGPGVPRGCSNRTMRPPPFTIASKSGIAPRGAP